MWWLTINKDIIKVYCEASERHVIGKPRLKRKEIIPNELLRPGENSMTDLAFCGT